MSAELDLKPEELQIVREILKKHLPDRRVLAFGSRVNGKARKYSDLDLVVMGETPLSLSTLATLAEAFSESPLPFKVDVVDWATTKEGFREAIMRGAVEVAVEGVGKGAVQLSPASIRH